jgi:chromosomal replication initiator protein
MIMIADIQRAVAREFSVPVAWMCQPAPRGRLKVNSYDASRPRQAAMALSVLLTNHSRTRIGQFFGGRDRATVYHACSAVAKRAVEDRRLRHAMVRIAVELTRSERVL